MLKATKRPPKPFADAPALFGDDADKRKSSLKNRIRGLERLLKKVRAGEAAARGRTGGTASGGVGVAQLPGRRVAATRSRVPRPPPPRGSYTTSPRRPPRAGRSLPRAGAGGFRQLRRGRCMPPSLVGVTRATHAARPAPGTRRSLTYPPTHPPRPPTTITTSTPSHTRARSPTWRSRRSRTSCGCSRSSRRSWRTRSLTGGSTRWARGTTRSSSLSGRR